ncbi:MAG: hypothetical protein AB7F76_14100 [Parvibaculaceae bacterium]|jgi:hypothetical protein
MNNTVVDKAISDPLRVFKTPAEVVEATDLSTDEKVKILENWELDARRLIESAGENMIDEKGRERDQLPEIQYALRKLGARPDPAT